MRQPFKKLRVALFTPLPPAKTGTADYGAALKEELLKLVSLTVYQNKTASFSPGRFDQIVYQIGNNHYHANIYETALRHPGVIVLHEASVQNLIRSSTWHRGNHKAYLREVVYEMFGDDIGHLSSKHLPVDLPQPHQFLMLRRLVDASKACIVHSRYAERLVRLKGFQGRIEVLPHGVALHSMDSLKYRRSLGLAPDTFLIGVFGYQRPDKQIWDCLVMFKELLDSRPYARLLILGEQSPQVPLQEGIRDLGLNRHVLVLGHQNLEDFDGYLSACSVVLNLRHNTLGETSGTMMRAFSLGRPVIVSDVGSARELPEGTCLRIPHDRYEVRVIAECLSWLASNPAATAEIGEQAKQWVARECTWSIVAQRYLALLERPLGDPPTKRRQRKSDISADRARAPLPLSESSILDYVSRWVDAASPDGQYFAIHSARLIHTLKLTPPGEVDCRILELGCYMQITPALRGLLGYGDVRGAYMGSLGGEERLSVSASDGEEFCCTINRFNCEVDRFPYPDENFDTVLCCELLEHLDVDPMHMMSEISRVLKPYGVLVLTTPNAASLRALRAIIHGANPNLFPHYGIPTMSTAPRHSREYTPKELLRLFADSGFAVQHIETSAYGERQGIYKWITKLIRWLKPITRLREDCVYIVGQKSAAVACRYPSWLYWHD